MIFKSRRGVVLPLSEVHFDDIIEMYNEPESNKFIAPLRNKTDEEFRKFLLQKVEKNKTEVGFWVVYSQMSNEFIGTVNLNYFDQLSFYHIGSHLKRKHWRQGWSSEILPELIDYGFNIKGLDKIFGLVQKGNEASSKMLQKLGFKYLKTTSLDDELDVFQILNQKSDKLAENEI